MFSYSGLTHSSAVSNYDPCVKLNNHILVSKLSLKMYGWDCFEIQVLWENMEYSARHVQRVWKGFFLDYWRVWTYISNGYCNLLKLGLPYRCGLYNSLLSSEWIHHFSSKRFAGTSFLPTSLFPRTQAILTKKEVCHQSIEVVLLLPTLPSNVYELTNQTSYIGIFSSFLYKFYPKPYIH